MGITNLFSGNSRRKGRGRRKNYKAPTTTNNNTTTNTETDTSTKSQSSKKDGNPKPYNFSILKAYVNGDTGCVAVMAVYPDCFNYDGKKVLVFDNWEKFNKEIFSKDDSLMDPHFLEGELTPFARFKPTDKGWKTAKKLVDRM